MRILVICKGHVCAVQWVLPNEHIPDELVPGTARTALATRRFRFVNGAVAARADSRRIVR
eukprot:4580947-Prymnesium_polylepis.1